MMDGMSNERFTYRGPAKIDGVPLPIVRLQEAPRQGYEPRSWDGLSSFGPASAPEGFPQNLPPGGPVPVELPDGRKGDILVRSVDFDGSAWVIHLEGTGQPPR